MLDKKTLFGFELVVQSQGWAAEEMLGCPSLPPPSTDHWLVSWRQFSHVLQPPPNADAQNMCTSPGINPNERITCSPIFGMAMVLS